MSNPSRFAGTFNAAEFAYGINKSTPSLLVVNGPNASGSGTLTIAFGFTNLNDGTIFNPLNTNAPILVGNKLYETVTPSAVSASTPTQFSTTTLTATFAQIHGNGDQIRSGTVGLQEALNFASAYGGGVVVVDAGWTSLGGTTAMIQSATYPAGVTFLDNRVSGANANKGQIVLTNTQVLNLFSTAVQVLPAPGVGSYYNILKATLVNESGGTAYASGGAITVGYGPTSGLVQALSGTIAATFLTSPTQTQVIQLAGANLASTTEATYDNQPIFINCATGNFTTGSGTLRVSLTYTVESK